MNMTKKGERPRIPLWQLQHEFGKVKNKIKDALLITSEEYLQRYPNTCCKVVVRFDGNEYSAMKYVTLNANDVWSPEEGRKITRNMALSEIAKHIAENERKRRLPAYKGNG
jgi:hypothetical protein